MEVPRPTRDQIIDRIYSDLISQTPFNANLDDSTIGVIIKSVGAELDSMWSTIQEVGKQASLFTAYGDGLDNWGEQIGVPRKLATKANSLGYTKPVRFVNLSGTTQLIPQGTRVWSDDNPQIAFFTLEGLTVPSGESGEVHVIASEVGDLFNVARGQIDKHSFTGGNVTVTNILPIQNGTFRESDDAYRSRLISEYRRRVVFNRDTCRDMLRSVPNVKDVLVLEGTRGPGTYDAIIIPYIETQTNATVQTAQGLIDEYSPIGLVGLAKAPTYRQLDVAITLSFRSNSVTRQTIREEVKAQITALVDALPVEDGSGSGTLYLSQIQGIAQDADSDVTGAEIRVGLDGSPQHLQGEVRLDLGEKILLRSIVVQ